MKSNNLEDMKEEYKAIKIPGQLKDIVEQSIQQAIEEGEPMKKEKQSATIIKIILKRTAQVAAAAIIVVTVMVNTSATVAQAMEKIPVIGAITKVITFRTYEKKTENMEAKIEVPQITNEDLTNAPAQLNKSVEEYTDELIARFEADMATGNGENHESVDTISKVLTDNDKMFSLRIDTTIAQGGAINISKIYHINKQTDSMMVLKDLFQDNADYVQVISDNIKEQMRAEMKADENIVYFIDSEAPESDFKAIDPNQNFYINEQGKLVMAFDKYAVAPGYMGTMDFEIPTEVVKDIVKEGYLN
ncbi:MAG: DUF3298 domain-containing protein [Lachnospiraceae bacterium]